MTLISSQARKQGIYKNYIHAAVDGLGTIPVTNEAYDVIVCSNGFAPGEETLCYEDGAKVRAYINQDEGCFNTFLPKYINMPFTMCYAG